ncbi:MAG: GMC family oxidoreductase [Deltaproteobacteria bacterium]|jgi:choline dehydrogenase-like flavoprotein|nr:GMC family oxidoreductase [Deltaproteobacteria bacterium]MBK8693811.1 GMC family oxidoreductase [Deltaproteobacteria bacterium]MBP6832048.1 GMC family oxidoreductase [Deltaproteobacteria bacterium]
MRVVDDVADFVIVGTGAGGATAARVLAGAGRDVLMLEEGPQLRTAERPAEVLDAMAMAFRDFATSTTRGSTPLPMLQGRCVGGATAINSGIIWRLPEDVRDEWIAQHGLSHLVERRALDDAFDQIERELEVTETSTALFGGNSERMAEACRVLGLPGQPMTRNAARCKGSARCLQGCPGEARQSMDVSYIPRAQRDGARLLTLARVDRVLIEWGRAVGVEGVLLDPVTRRPVAQLRVMAREAVIVSASAIQTPVILRRSGLRGMVGERFQAHPGCAVVGRFDEPIEMSHGATQGYEVPLRDRRLKVETLALPPELLAPRLPGAGAAWQSRLAEMDHYAQWSFICRMEAHGRVRPALFGGGSDAAVHFTPTARDMERVKDGIGLVCRMMFAAGAREVFPGIGELPSVLKSVDEVDAIDRATLRPQHVNMITSHLFGTACAGSDPRASAVDENLAVHDVRGLHVMDASVFPTNLGVNPQHSIMALTWVAASRLANRSLHRQVAA